VRWLLDKAHTRIGFSVKHMIVTTVRGHFKSYTGALQLDTHDFTRSTFAGDIDVASIDTGSADRDSQLRTNDFLAVPAYPKLTFLSTHVSPKGSGAYVVHGELTIRGVTRAVGLEVAYPGTSKDPDGKTVANLSVRGTVKRKDFGVNFNALLEAGGLSVGDTVKIELEVRAVLEEAASADGQ
jgi:polyisoprenoid-binding protein YceI